MYTERQLTQYFERIHYFGNAEVNYETLSALMIQHLLSIAYENLDLLNDVPLSLDPDDLFDKIVIRKRGGYCFELQGAFYCLLKSLGYNVAQYAGRFIDGTGVTQMRRHRILVVSIAGKRYVADVGVRSESARIPLKLEEGLVQSDGISDYRYQRDPFYGWVLQRRAAGGDWTPRLGFTEEPQIDADYVMPSFFCEQHPESTFNKFMKVSLFTETADLTIVENTFKVYSGGRVIERRELRTNEEARECLTKTFGIAVPKEFRRFI